MKKTNIKKSKKKTKPSKSAQPVKVIKKPEPPKPRKKNAYEKSFEANLVNIKPPALTTEVKFKVVKGKSVIYQVQVVHPSKEKDDPTRVLWEKNLPQRTTINEAMDIGNKMKAKLTPITKTWVEGSPDDPNYIHEEKKN